MPPSLPEQMQVVEISRPGGPEVLKTAMRSIPRPKPGEVLIRVAAAGVNRPDVLQRRGFYAPPPGAPSIPGLEVAGEVVAIGEGVQPELIGQPVCALVAGVKMGSGSLSLSRSPAGKRMPQTVPLC